MPLCQHANMIHGECCGHGMCLFCLLVHVCPCDTQVVGTVRKSKATSKQPKSKATSKLHQSKASSHIYVEERSFSHLISVLEELDR
jgi:hypothetical protein